MGRKISEFRRRQVSDRDGNACKQCGWKFGDPVPTISRRTGFTTYRTLEIDHIIPVALGGTNAVENLQILCTTCNARKGARL